MNDDLIDLECYDAMAKGNQPYVDDSAAMLWPKPMTEVVDRIAEQMGVTLDSRTYIHPCGDIDNDVDYSELTLKITGSTTYTLAAYSSGGSVAIEWGDGATGTLRTSSSATANTHTYSSAGTYKIRLTPSGNAKVMFYKASYSSTASDDNVLKSAYVGKKGEISSNAFARCSALTKFRMANNLTSIGSRAFYNCTALTYMELPATITNISGYAFYSCTNMPIVRVKATTPPTLGNNIVMNNSVTKFEVPANSRNAYVSASGWSSIGSARILSYTPYVGSNDYVIYKPNDDDTLLDVLKCIAEVHGGNWVMTAENKLRLVPLVPPPAESFNVVDYDYNHILTDDGYSLVWQQNSNNTVVVNPAQGELLNVPVVIGKIETATPYTISKIIMTKKPSSDDTESQIEAYVAGNDTGYALTIDQNPSATQNICNALYAQLNGLTYAPFNVTDACFDPCAEYGDWIVVADKVRSTLYNQKQTFDLNYRSDISAPGQDEIDEEFAFETPQQKMRHEIVALSRDSAVYRSEIRQTQNQIALTISELNTKADKSQIRSQFAMDETSINITSGTINFKSETLTVDTDNFKLDKYGNLECSNAKMNGSLRTVYTDAYNVTVFDVKDGAMNIISASPNSFDTSDYDNIYNVSDRAVLTIKNFYYYNGYGSSQQLNSTAEVTADNGTNLCLRAIYWNTSYSYNGASLYLTSLGDGYLPANSMIVKGESHLDGAIYTGSNKGITGAWWTASTGNSPICLFFDNGLLYYVSQGN